MQQYIVVYGRSSSIQYYICVLLHVQQYTDACVVVRGPVDSGGPAHICSSMRTSIFVREKKKKNREDPQIAADQHTYVVECVLVWGHIYSSMRTRIQRRPGHYSSMRKSMSESVRTHMSVESSMKTRIQRRQAHIQQYECQYDDTNRSMRTRIYQRPGSTQSTGSGSLSS